MMEQEQIIIKFNFKAITSFGMIENIAYNGYMKTGNKFIVQFNGSKGYIDNIEIFCEGEQIENNRIDVYKMRNKDRSLKSKIINVFHSKEHGVRVSINKDFPRWIERDIDLDELEPSNELPF